MRLSRLLLLPLLFITSSVFAQYSKIENGYYQFPIQPERTNYLSGNMGELRASHFHAGLDIKTNGIEGLEVYSAAEGYVSRIAVSTGGYGNAVYVVHPNGTTTVYAHLQRFNPELAKYVLESQYKQKSFGVNLFPDRGRFKLKKGEVLGYSGNTGSSSGPHLHFEIRDINQEVLDPLRIGFTEIKDRIAPIAERIALKTMDINSRVNGQFGRFEFNLEKRGNEYVITDTILATGKIGLEIWAHDKLDGAANKNGVPEIDVYKNLRLLFSQRIDLVNFSLQNNIKVHTNYKAEQETNRRYNKLYIDDGNNLGFYNDMKDRGFFYPKKDSIYFFQIVLADAYGNQRRVTFNVKGAPLSNTELAQVDSRNHSYLLDNTLQINRKRKDELNNITVYTRQGSHVLEPAYSNGEDNVYLVDLNKGLPKTIDYGDDQEEIDFIDMIPSEKEHSYLSNSFSAAFGKNTLFDTLYLKARHYIDESKNIEILQIGDEVSALKGIVEVELVPLLTYDSLKQFQVYALSNSGNASYIGGTWYDGKIRFAISSLGNFTLKSDVTPPTINQRVSSNGIVYFNIDDDLSGIKEYEATIDGKWLLMNYEPKKKLIWSETLDKSKPLKGDFALTVTDYAGNKKTLTLKL
ncbi:M23 family metallopeptidase [Roseivirga echinicomitans]